MNFLRFLFFFAFMVLRIPLIVIGWFFIPLTLIADGQYNTAPLWRHVYGNVADIMYTYHKGSFWKKYVWMAWRNPTNGLKGMFTQPVPEVHPNPDHKIRNGYLRASRTMESGPYWEYWWMRTIDWKIRDTHYKYFEFRIGWKFVDGNNEFFPTIQLGPRSS